MENLDDWVEMAVYQYQPMTNTIKLDHALASDQIDLLQMGNNIVRQTVVKRDDDLFTPAQVKEHWPEVRAAMLKELQIWQRLKRVSRRPWQGGRNIIYVRWVINYKWETPTTSAASGEGHRADTQAAPLRTIRARLAVRGFKDSDKGDIDR